MLNKLIGFGTVILPLCMLGCAAGTGEDTENSADALSERGALPMCVAQTACVSSTGPRLGRPRGFDHWSSIATSLAGDPNHRGRDQIYVEGQPQVLIGKFAYGLADKDIKDETVDIYLERGCGGQWEKLGSSKTTRDGDRPTLEGIEDDGGRIYFPLTGARALGVGRHRVRMVVTGDNSFADMVIEVVPANTTYFVADIDGTLTTSETAAWTALLTGDLPKARPHAAEALRALAAKGIRPLYLTARPEWLKGRTEEFLQVNGFPPGVLQTTQTVIPAFSSASTEFKTAALGRLSARGVKFSWAFGNKAHDGDTYANAAIQPLSQRVFVELDDVHGGQRIDSYAEILPAVRAAAPACR